MLSLSPRKHTVKSFSKRKGHNSPSEFIRSRDKRDKSFRRKKYLKSYIRKPAEQINDNKLVRKSRCKKIDKKVSVKVDQNDSSSGENSPEPIYTFVSKYSRSYPTGNRKAIISRNKFKKPKRKNLQLNVPFNSRKKTIISIYPRNSRNKM